MNPELKKFVEKYISYVEENKIDALYRCLKNETEIEASSLTAVLKEAGIEPLDFMTKIQPNMYRRDMDLLRMIIPDHIQKIGPRAFMDCIFLKEVLIPQSCTGVGRQAFMNCYQLQHVIIKNGVQTLYPDAFCNCEKIVDITLPDSLTELYPGVFRECRNLKHVTLSKYVSSLPSGLFDMCLQLEHIYFGGTDIDWDNLSKQDNWLPKLPHDVTIHCANRVNYTYRDQVKV